MVLILFSEYGEDNHSMWTWWKGLFEKCVVFIFVDISVLNFKILEDGEEIMCAWDIWIRGFQFFDMVECCCLCYSFSFWSQLWRLLSFIYFFPNLGILVSKSIFVATVPSSFLVSNFPVQFWQISVILSVLMWSICQWVCTNNIQ